MEGFSVCIGHVYDGPMDLLLELIRCQNLDIHDIPMGTITAQFLEYCRGAKADIDESGEFLYTASLLIHIKSKMLLPRYAFEFSGGEIEDPRRELVDQLLEHQRFMARSAAEMLMQKQHIEGATWSKPRVSSLPLDVDTNETMPTDKETGTVDLMLVVENILERLRAAPPHRVAEEPVTVTQMIDYLSRRISIEDSPLSLTAVLQDVPSGSTAICIFLAMLEMVRLQAILVYQPLRPGDILMKKTGGMSDVMAGHVFAVDDFRYGSSAGTSVGASM